MPLFRLPLLLLCSLLLHSAERSLTILHFNDLHAAVTADAKGEGGIVSLAGILARERDLCRSCIVLSSGDFVQGSPVSTIFRGLPVIEMANRLKVDAATLGNHEFDYGWRQTARFLRAAKFPIVSADLVDGEGRLFARKPYVILKRNGLRVGVLGVMTQDLKTLTTPDTRGPLRTLPLAEVVARYADELRAKSDLVVLLAHVSPREEEAILQASPFPVVISGHTHSGVTEPRRNAGRMLVRVRSNGAELGRLDLKVDTACKCVTSSEWKRLPVTARSAPPAPAVAKIVAQWEKKVAAVVDAPIGESRREFAGADLKQLIERATVEMLGVDFSFMNRGGVRAPLPAGRLLARHVWNAYPFDNRVVIGTFLGKDLPAVVTEGRAIDPNREYTLAVNDFTAANQEAPSQLRSTGLVFPKVGPLQRDLLIEWIKKRRILE